MSESSEEKSKRKYLHLLQNHQWSYQHSLFYEDLNDSTALLDDMIGFKQELRRKCPDQAFLIRIQLLSRKKAFNPEGLTQAYLVIFTTKNASDAILTETSFGTVARLMSRSLSKEKLNQIALAVKTQRPHDLERFFGKKKINRFSLLNKKQLIKTV